MITRTIEGLHPDLEEELVLTAHSETLDLRATTWHGTGQVVVDVSIRITDVVNIIKTLPHVDHTDENGYRVSAHDPKQYIEFSWYNKTKLQLVLFAGEVWTCITVEAVTFMATILEMVKEQEKAMRLFKNQKEDETEVNGSEKEAEANGPRPITANEVLPGDTIEVTWDTREVSLSATGVAHHSTFGTWKTSDGERLTGYASYEKIRLLSRPEPELPQEPGSVVKAYRVRGKEFKDGVVLVRSLSGWWFSPYLIDGVYSHADRFVENWKLGKFEED